MVKAFSVVSWNCEHWREDDFRNENRIDFLAEQGAGRCAQLDDDGRPNLIRVGEEN